MKTINDKTLLEIVETLESNVKSLALEFGDEISEDYQNRINELKQALTPKPITAQEICKETKILKQFAKAYDQRSGIKYTHKEIVESYEKVVEDNHEYFYKLLEEETK